MNSGREGFAEILAFVIVFLLLLSLSSSFIFAEIDAIVNLEEARKQSLLRLEFWEMADFCLVSVGPNTYRIENCGQIPVHNVQVFLIRDSNISLLFSYDEFLPGDSTPDINTNPLDRIFVKSVERAEQFFIS